MRRNSIVFIIAVAIISFFLGSFFTRQKSTSAKPVVVSDSTTTPTISLSPTQLPQQFSQGNTQATTPTPTITTTNPFLYTPLPTNRGGPENDIIETSPLTASRMSAQVDDSITFSVTIKNQAPYNKRLWDFCFESTDGNFGCIFGIQLASGQTYTLNNVGTWTNPGIKRIWVTWSQDFINYYTPLNATILSIQIIG